MKNTHPFFLIILLLGIFSCKPDSKQTTKEKTSAPTIIENTSVKKSGGDPDLSQFSKLVPIEIKDDKSTDIYKKYGLEFSGNCYACDLAVFKINKKNFDLVNICDENDFERYKKFTHENSDDVFKIGTPETIFIFTKVEKEPIYQLKIEGKKPNFNNKRIAKFYTVENLIEKFEEHDCDDFEG